MPSLENPSHSSPPESVDAVLDPARLRRALDARGLKHVTAEILDVTASTNALLAERAEAGEATHGALIAARHQEQAKGRLGRAWVTPPDSALLFSLLVDPQALLPGVPLSTERCGLVPLAAGAAAVRAVRETTGLPAQLKWPNDVLVNERKLAGILCQLVALPQGGFGVVIGVGLNVRQRADELPVPTATSLEASGAGEADADELLARIVAETMTVAREALRSGDLTEIRRVMSTLGSRVRVERSADDPAQDEYGTAVEIAPNGGLVVRTDDGRDVAVQAGDVWHVRPEESPRTSTPGAQA